MRNLITQCIFRIASGYEDGAERFFAGHPNDENTLRRDPLFKLAAGRTPLDTNNKLACGATFSRLEGALRRSDIYRIACALDEQFIAGYECAQASITLDLDDTDGATYGLQALFFNLQYGHYIQASVMLF